MNRVMNALNVNTRQIRAFLTVARLRNFTRAAENLHMTQSGLSAVIRELEQQFDAKLFERTTRAVALTQAGRQLVPRAERLLSELADTAIALQRSREERRRTLTIAVAPIVTASLMPRVCSEFRRRQPDVSVRFMDFDRVPLQAAVDSGEADAGFGAFLPASTSVSRRKITSFALVCVCRKGLFADVKSSARGVVSWADVAAKLHENTLFTLPSDDSTQQIIEGCLATLPASTGARWGFRSMYAMIAMAAAGEGVAIVPAFAMTAIRNTKAQVLGIQGPRVAVDYFCIQRKGADTLDHLEVFIDTFKTVAESMLPPRR